MRKAQDLQVLSPFGIFSANSQVSFRKLPDWGIFEGSLGGIAAFKSGPKFTKVGQM